MQMVLDRPIVTVPTMSEDDAHYVACRYVEREIDATFDVVSDTHSNRQMGERALWRFFVCCRDGPLHAIQVDAQRGEVIPFSQAQIRLLREKAAIFAARKAGVLPLDGHGYVLGEYARRRADRYLGDEIGMYFGAADPVFAAGEPPYWQVTIFFKRYELGPFTLGVMDVDATTGEPISLTKTQLKRIRERAHALIEFHTQAAAA